MLKFRRCGAVAAALLLAGLLSSCGGLGADTSCADFLKATAADQSKAVSSMKDHFTAAFGSEDNTVATLVQALDTNCQGRSSSKIKDVLYNLGYYGN